MGNNSGRKRVAPNSTAFELVDAVCATDSPGNGMSISAIRSSVHSLVVTVSGQSLEKKGNCARIIAKCAAMLGKPEKSIYRRSHDQLCVLYPDVESALTSLSTLHEKYGQTSKVELDNVSLQA